MASFDVFSLALISLGPSLILFSCFVFKSASRLMIFIGSAFLWYTCLFFSSLLWFGIKTKPEISPLISSLFVLLLESARLMWGILLKKADTSLLHILEKNHPKRFYIYAMISGMGFGTTSALFSMGNLLGALSDGRFFGLGGRSQNFGLESAVFALYLSILHIFWNIFTHHAIEKKNFFYTIIPVCSHFLSSNINYVNHLGKSYITHVVQLTSLLVLLPLSCYIMDMRIKRSNQSS